MSTTTRKLTPFGEQLPLSATARSAESRLEAASHGELPALGQVRRCPICARGLIPAPPAERRCDRCGAVVVVPQYTDVPRDFLRWLELQVARRQMPAYLTRQGVFERWVGNLYHGTTWGEGAERRLITCVAPVGDCYALALIDYQRWVASGSPTDLWTVTL